MEDDFETRYKTDKEVNDILIANGIEPMPRYGGDIDLKEFGLAI